MPRDAGPVLREATPADITAIARIYGREVECGIATFEIVPPTPSEMERRMTRIIEMGLPYLVAESSGEILGYGYAAPFNDRPGYRFTLEDTIYLDPAAQGRGLGARLLGALVDRGAAAGGRQMMAKITAANAGSVALHAKLGFRRVGELRGVGWKLGRWVDVVYMQRALGDGDTTPPVRSANRNSEKI